MTEQDVSLKLKEGYFILRQRDKDKAPELFKKFYRQKGLPRIARRVRYFKELMGVGVGTDNIRIIDLQNRWASCSSNRGLTSHWKCLIAPLTILNYVIVHKMAHLKFYGHSDAFWNEADKILTDYRERKTWLRFNGTSIDL